MDTIQNAAKPDPSNDGVQSVTKEVANTEVETEAKELTPAELAAAQKAIEAAKESERKIAAHKQAIRGKKLAEVKAAIKEFEFTAAELGIKATRVSKKGGTGGSKDPAKDPAKAAIKALAKKELNIEVTELKDEDDRLVFEDGNNKYTYKKKGGAPAWLKNLVKDLPDEDAKVAALKTVWKKQPVAKKK